MKKFLLSVSAISICLGLSAQISLSTSDIATVNKIIYTGTDTLVTGNSIIGSAGTNQVWSMTSLTPDVLDTITFLSPGTVPNSNYPGANLVAQLGSQNNYRYMLNSSGSLTSHGNSLSILGKVANQVYTPSEIVLNFPTNYNSSFTSNYQVNTKLYYGVSGVDSIREKAIVRKTSLTDAWGSLTTPYGTNNTLRNKETVITIDTVEIFYFGNWLVYSATADSTTSYVWWANTIGYPLATATMDSTGNVRSIEWLKATGLVGIVEQVAVPGINAYPNPAQYEIHFDIEALKAASVNVYDITGKLINEYAVKYNRLTINTTHFTNGIYMYSVIGQDKEILKQGKFTVSK